MLDILIVDDQDFELILECIEQNDSILQGKCTVYSTKFATTIPEKEAKYHKKNEVAIEIIRESRNIDIAFLDISFPNEGRPEYEAVQLIIDALKEYHKCCQIIITSLFQNAPKPLYEYEVNNGKYLSITKQFSRMPVDEYNKVFKKALLNWSRLHLIKEADQKEQTRILEAARSGKLQRTVGPKELYDLVFFLDEGKTASRYLLETFVSMPIIVTSKKHYLNIDPEELFMEFYVKRGSEYSSETTIDMIANIVYQILRNDVIRYNIGEQHFEKMLKEKLIPDENRNDFSRFNLNNDAIRKYQMKGGPPYHYLTSDFNYQKDRHGNIDDETLDVFEKILYQRLFAFFFYFSLHFDTSVIYNLLSNLSFLSSDSGKARQYFTQVLLIKHFDNRSFAILDKEGKNDDVRFKNFFLVTSQLASYEKDLILKISKKIMSLIDTEMVGDSHCKQRLEQVSRLITPYFESLNTLKEL